MRGGWFAGALLLALTAPPSGAAEVPRLLRDIVTQPVPSSGALGLPECFVQVNDRLLFSTPSGNFGEDEGFLWSTDGTAEGTHAVSSTICPFPCQSVTPVATWPGVALMKATTAGPSENVLGRRLWRTDGTPDGTFPLTARLPPGGLEAFAAGSSPGTGLFYFFDCVPGGDCQLWRSDGTLLGTHTVTDLKFFPASLLAAAGRLYFLATSVAGTGLWVTDGTADGTRLLAATASGVSASDLMTATPSRLFFTAGESDLWVSDGTPGGTRLVHSFDQFPDGCAAFSPFLEPAGEAVDFLARDSVHGAQIWRSDGTESGTRRLTDIQDCEMAQAVPLLRAGGRRVFSFPGTGGPLWVAGDDFSHPAPLTGCAEGCPQLFTSFPFAQESPPGRLLFVGKDARGFNLWVTDGTGGGTQRLTGGCPGSACGGFDFNADFTAPLAVRRLGKTYFRTQGPSADELWVTDGTPGGTSRIATSPSAVESFRDRVFFGSTRIWGDTSDLWMTDGTKAGNRHVARLRTLAPGSQPFFAPVGGGALIVAVESEGDLNTLWRSDGTPEGTLPLHGLERSITSLVTPVGGLGFFTSSLNLDRDEVWRTDGTARGTFAVTSPGAGTFLRNSTAWDGKFLFVLGGLSSPTAEDAGACAFWTSDGTRRGTREIFPLPAGVQCPLGLHSFGSRFLFIARVEGDGDLTPQVFLSDGTAAGTRQVSDVQGPRPVLDPELTETGGVVFFQLDRQGFRDGEVWRTDGTPAGTYLLPLGLFDIDSLFAFQGSLYLTGGMVGDPGGTNFWRVPIDGGPPVPLTNARTASDLSFFVDPAFTPAGGRLFFVAGDEAHGSELWVTDGSPEGTRMVRDVQPGAPSSYPSGLTAAGDRIYFAADDGVSGRELWVSDGTEEGTRLVWDVNPGGFSSSPSELTVIGGYLFFGADDGKTGMEPWALKLEP
jgi:ELWxxDGT repeat protein